MGVKYGALAQLTWCTTFIPFPVFSTLLNPDMQLFQTLGATFREIGWHTGTSVWQLDNEDAFWSHKCSATNFFYQEKLKCHFLPGMLAAHPAVWPPLLLSSHLISWCLINYYLRVLSPSLNSDLMWQGDRKQGRGGTEIKEQEIKITVPGLAEWSRAHQHQ